MKRILLPIATVSFLLFATGSAQAAPIVLTFEGTVTQNSYYWPDFCSPGDPRCGTGLPIGSPATFVALVDYDVPVYFGFPPDVVRPWYAFHACYISGPSVYAALYGYPCGVGVDRPLYGPGGEYLFGGPPWVDWEYGFSLSGRTTSVANWVVGTPIRGREWFPQFASITYDLHVTSITSPVPEPASLILFGTGLVGLRAWRRRGQ